MRISFRLTAGLGLMSVLGPAQQMLDVGRYSKQIGVLSPGQRVPIFVRTLLPLEEAAVEPPNEWPASLGGVTAAFTLSGRSSPALEFRIGSIRRLAITAPELGNCLYAIEIQVPFEARTTSWGIQEFSYLCLLSRICG